MYALVSAPGVSSIRSWADLKGKRVAFLQGTALESALLEGLGVGRVAPLRHHHRQRASHPGSRQRCKASAPRSLGIEVEPLLSVYFQGEPQLLTSLRTRQPSRRRPAFSSQRPLGSHHASKTSAIADYITRLIKAYAYLKIHPQADDPHRVRGPVRRHAGAGSRRFRPPSDRRAFFELPGAVLGTAAEPGEPLPGGRLHPVARSW